MSRNRGRAFVQEILAGIGIAEHSHTKHEYEYLCERLTDNELLSVGRLLYEVLWKTHRVGHLPYTQGLGAIKQAMEGK